MIYLAFLFQRYSRESQIKMHLLGQVWSVQCSMGLGTCRQHFGIPHPELFAKVIIHIIGIACLVQFNSQALSNSAGVCHSLSLTSGAKLHLLMICVDCCKM